MYSGLPDRGVRLLGPVDVHNDSGSRKSAEIGVLGAHDVQIRHLALKTEHDIGIEILVTREPDHRAAP